MDKYVQQLLDDMHTLMHRIEGYLDAKADLKPQLQISYIAPKVLQFPQKKLPDPGEFLSNSINDDEGTSPKEETGIIKSTQNHWILGAFFMC